MKKLLFLVAVLLVSFSAVGCTSSERVAWNLNYEAEEFNLLRRIAAVNGFTDSPIFEIVGYCSIETGSSYVEGTLEITCRIADDEYTKNFVYLSDNVMIVVEQLEGIDVPRYHYQIIFAPQALLPIPVIVYDTLGE